MKLFIDVNGLTKVVLLDDSNATVFNQNCFFEQVDATLKEMASTFPPEKVSQVYVSGPKKMTGHLVSDIRPTFPNATYIFR